MTSARPSGRHALRARLGLVLVLSLPAAPSLRAEVHDPLEPVNRAVWRFNETVDRWALAPLARAYEHVTPAPLRNAVASVFGNLGEPLNAVLHLAQGDPADSARSVLRFAVNSSFGLLGLFDVAAASGLEERDTDIGQTLGVWGVPPGPYVVLPLLGPSSARDAPGDLAGLAVDPVGNLSDVPVRNSLQLVRAVSARAALLPADALLEDSFLDRYAFVREAVAARRQRLVDEARERAAGPRDADPSAPPPTEEAR